MPHGDPDPHGHRLAYLRSVTRRALPATATISTTTVRDYSWDPAECDGLMPGWAAAEIDVTFHVADLACVDAPCAI